MKKINFVQKILKTSEYSTKIYIYMSSKVAGDDYDSYEDNKVYTNLNPIVIKGYVRELSSETAFYKQYGIHQAGMKEILCEERFRTAFENANKIAIDGINYQSFKAGTGNNVMITKRPYKTIRVVVSRLD